MAPALSRLRPPRATPLEVWRRLLAGGSTFSRAVHDAPPALDERARRLAGFDLLGHETLARGAPFR